MNLAEILSMKKSSQSNIDRKRSQNKNVQKHLRIASATTGHEKEVHLAKAKKLSKKYGI